MRIVPRWRSDYWFFCAKMMGVLFCVVIICLTTVAVLFAL